MREESYVVVRKLKSWWSDDQMKINLIIERFFFFYLPVCDKSVKTFVNLSKGKENLKRKKIFELYDERMKDF